MLKKILAISGKPGLYKLVSQGKNMLVVESLLNGKRTPAYNHEKIISLGDIAMFTDSDEVPLNEVFESMKQLENGGKASVSTKDSEKTLRDTWAKYSPTSTATACTQPTSRNSLHGTTYSLTTDSQVSMTKKNKNKRTKQHNNITASINKNTRS